MQYKRLTNMNQYGDILYTGDFKKMIIVIQEIILNQQFIQQITFIKKK